MNRAQGWLFPITNLSGRGCGFCRARLDRPAIRRSTFSDNIHKATERAHDIPPILYEKCAPGHHPGAAAPFSLLTYEDVKKRGAQIAAATRTGFMPPWL